MSEHNWRRVTVIGCGLIGASFALALRRAHPRSLVAGWDSSPAALRAALSLGAIDRVDDSFADAPDLIYLAMPVAAIISFLRERGRSLPTASLVTDAGSTKREICLAAREHLPPACTFVGGHPVAGSHQTGPEAARANLFEGAAYALTPEREGAAFRRLRELIEGFGACVRMMSAAEHDRALAFTSHLPQLLSSALAATLDARPDRETLRPLCGPGYRDMTRLADSSWGVWRDILATNADEIGVALDAYLERLIEVRDELRERSSPFEKAENLFQK